MITTFCVLCNYILVKYMSHETVTTVEFGSDNNKQQNFRNSECQLEKKVVNKIISFCCHTFYLLKDPFFKTN